MITLKTVLDTLNNNFVDNRIIETVEEEAVIIDGRITATGVNAIPVNAYFIIEGTIFNNEVYQVTASGTDYIEASDILADPSTDVEVKTCIIPKAVLDFVTEYAIKPIPTLKSETIGNYSYSTDKEGVKGFIINQLSAYYNGVRI